MIPNAFCRGRINMVVNGGKRGDRIIVHYTFAAREIMVKTWVDGWYWGDEIPKKMTPFCQTLTERERVQFSSLTWGGIRKTPGDRIPLVGTV